MIRNFNQRREQITLTSAMNWASSPPTQPKSMTKTRSDRARADWLLDRAHLQDPRPAGHPAIRVLHGLLSLGENHPAKALEQACHKPFITVPGACETCAKDHLHAVKQVVLQLAEIDLQQRWLRVVGLTLGDNNLPNLRLIFGNQRIIFFRQFHDAR